MIVDQHISVYRFFDLAILCGDTTGHYVMRRAVVADPFVFREWMKSEVSWVNWILSDIESFFNEVVGRGS